MGSKWGRAADEEIPFTAQIRIFHPGEGSEAPVMALVRAGSVRSLDAGALPRPLLYTDPFWRSDVNEDPREDSGHPAVGPFHWYSWFELTVEYDVEHPEGVQTAYVRPRVVGGKELVGTWDEDDGDEDSYQVTAEGFSANIILKDPVV